MSARATMKRASEAHRVIDAAPISQEAKHLGHLLVVRFASLGWQYVSASCDTLASWLEENYNLRGCRYRIGRRGPAKCGPKRRTLSRESIRRYVHELLRADLLEVQGGGRAVGRRFAGKKPRGLRWWLRPSGLLWDALRGAYKAWRTEFDRISAGESNAPPLPALASAVRSAPPPAASSSLSWSTGSSSGREQKVSPAATLSLAVPLVIDAPAKPRTIEAHRSQQSDDDDSIEAHVARFAAFVARVGVDPPSED